MTTAEAPIRILPGVYHRAEFGVTLIEDGSVLWSVDVAVGIDGVTIVGNGPTPESAAADAVQNLRPFIEETS